MNKIDIVKFTDGLKAALAVDDFANKVINWRENEDVLVPQSIQLLYRQFKWHNGLLYKGRTLYVPDGVLRTELLERYHDSILAGHQGTKRTLSKLVQNYYWPGINTDVERFVRSCDTCQRFAESSSKPVGLLHPLPIPQDRFKDISIDFATINKVGKYDQLMVIVDRLTKLVSLVPGSKTDSTEKIAQRFVRSWYCRGFGVPESITSDRDARFTSSLSANSYKSGR